MDTVNTFVVTYLLIAIIGISIIGGLVAVSGLFFLVRSKFTRLDELPYIIIGSTACILCLVAASVVLNNA